MNLTTLKQKITNLLLWSQRYLKTDMLYVAGGSFWSTSSQMVASGSAFILSIGFANLISPEAYGTYRYLLSLAELVGIFSLSGFAHAIVSAVAQGKDGILRAVFWKNIRWSTLGTLVASVAGIYYITRGNSILGYGLIAIGIFLPFLKSASFSSSFLSGKKDFRRQAQFESGRTILAAAIMLTSLFFTKNPLVLVIIYFASHTLLASLFYLLTIRIYQPPKSLDALSNRFGKHQTFLGVLGTVSDQIDKVVIFHYLGPVQLAIYSFAIAVPDQVRNLLKRIHALAIPKFAEKKSDTLYASVTQKIFPSLVILVPLIVVYILAAPFLYRFFFPQYVASIPYSLVYALTFLGYANLANNALIGQQAIKESYIVNTTGIVLRIVFILLFGFWYGIWGILIGRILAKSFTSAVAIILLRKFSQKQQV